MGRLCSRTGNSGVAAALRAKLDPERILNDMPTDQLLEWVYSRSPDCTSSVECSNPGGSPWMLNLLI